MTPNSENAMARFLFAILKQKNLRDIDWNEVASDPVLLEPITNGHAARMRFFRFRTTVGGRSAHKRGVSGSKARVTKAKKTQAKEETVFKSEMMTPGLSSYDPFSPSTASLASPYMDAEDDFNRLLTPCSDVTPQALVVHPAALENRRIHSMPLFPPATCSTDFLNHAVQPAHHAHSPSLSTYDGAYDFDTYGSGVRAMHGKHLANPAHAQDLTDCTPEWDDRFNDTQHF